MLSNILHFDTMSINEIKSNLGISKDFFVVTVHRDENLNNAILEEIFTGLNTFSEDYDIILPAHPRLKKFIDNNSLDTGNLLLVDSLPYVRFLSLVLNSKVCLTDSGGLQTRRRSRIWPAPDAD